MPVCVKLKPVSKRSRVEHAEVNAERDEVQKQFYGLGAEVARLEQRIQHRQEQILNWRRELSGVESLCQELEDHTEEQRQHIEELSAELIILEPESAAAKAARRRQGRHCRPLKQKMQQWQRRWDVFQTESSQFAAQAGVLKTNLQHYEQQLNNLNLRQLHLREASAAVASGWPCCGDHTLNRRNRAMASTAGNVTKRISAYQRSHTRTTSAKYRFQTTTG